MTTNTNYSSADALSNLQSSQASGTAAANTADTLASENTFLKLLVAQIKNQDPTNPTDPVQFVGQLTQYSELEQLMQINSNVKTLGTSPSSSPTSSASDPFSQTTNTP